MHIMIRPEVEGIIKLHNVSMATFHSIFAQGIQIDHKQN